MRACVSETPFCYKDMISMAACLLLTRALKQGLNPVSTLWVWLIETKHEVSQCCDN